MNMRRVMFALAAVAAGLALGGGDGFAASAEKGKQLFLKNGCWQCHGEKGQGGVTGFKLAPDPIPFETLQTFVRTTNRNMPAYRESILSNDDLADISAVDGIAGAGPHDFQDEVLVENQAFARRGFESDQAEIGGAERLKGVDAARFHFVLQRFRKRRARNRRALDR